MSKLDSQLEVKNRELENIIQENIFLNKENLEIKCQLKDKEEIINQLYQTLTLIEIQLKQTIH